MTGRSSGFGTDFGGRIAERARRCGIELAPSAVAALLAHAEALRAANLTLHLTTILEPDEWLERHLGESFEGASLIDPAASGALLDLGSGNGYPGLALAAARPGLRPRLAEASLRKAGFLRSVIETGFPDGEVLARSVQRPADLPSGERYRVIASRAMGGWEKVLPRLSGCLEEDGEVLVWAGEQAESVVGRSAWQRYRLVRRRSLPGRDRSWIWHFRAAR